MRHKTFTPEELAARLRGLPDGFHLDVVLVCPFCPVERLVAASYHGEMGVVHEMPQCKEFDSEEDPAMFLRACRLRMSD